MQTTSNSTQVTGTPAYMAPECFYAVRSMQTDIWAVGIIFHLLLTGKLPFPQPDQISVMNAILNSEPQIQNDILPIYREIIEKALRKDVTQRYLSVGGMQEDLDGFGTKFFAKNQDKIVFQLSDTFHPNSDREDETLVIPKFLQNQTNSFGARKFIGIAAALSVILIVTAVWAGFQFGKKENMAETKTLDATNTNSSLNVSSEILTNANLNENITVSNKKLPSESNSRKNQTGISPTPYVLQPRNSHDRDGQSERQYIDPNDYDIMTPTPIPRKTPMATPVKTPTPQRMITEDCRYNRRCN